MIRTPALIFAVILSLSAAFACAESRAQTIQGIEGATSSEVDAFTTLVKLYVIADFCNDADLNFTDDELELLSDAATALQSKIPEITRSEIIQSAQERFRAGEVPQLGRDGLEQACSEAHDTYYRLALER